MFRKWFSLDFLWTSKKHDRKSIDVFELWRFLKIPWISQEINRIVTKQINPEAQITRLNLSYFKCITQKTIPLEESVMLER